MSGKSDIERTTPRSHNTDGPHDEYCVLLFLVSWLIKYWADRTRHGDVINDGKFDLRHLRVALFRIERRQAEAQSYITSE